EKYGKTDEMVDRANSYCTMDESDRADFIEEHRAEFREHMKDHMMDKKSHHMNYERLCALTDSERAAEIDDSEKLERLANWCEMTPEEREEYKKEHHGEMKEKMHDKVMDKAHDKKHEMKMKLSDKSDRIKAMIMSNYDISDEKRAEIKAKYMEKYGDLTDEKKSELKMKFAKHLKSMKHNFSDERKSDIQDRVAEMKAFKAELRERSSDLTDEEKQQLSMDYSTCSDCSWRRFS
ncbi:MAG: ABC transporter substrate-binding protein, partial [Nitrosopumilaceae archaeon]|nr:ABC transporter substrate-binding protein [Nitrosopumilaceae archaeon]